MPGLNDYLTSKLRMPTRMYHPWTHIGFCNYSQPVTLKNNVRNGSWLALVDPKEIWK